jgi:DNA-binding transcriptional ArsR family regulator
VPTSLGPQAKVFAALGDPTRLRLLDRLARGEPLSISRLTGSGKMTRQAITKHLRVLERAGLVRGARRGRERHWALAPGKLAEARRCLEGISMQWDAALERLLEFVERS